MILEIAPDAPRLIHAAAGVALALHVAGGAAGIVSGWAAVAARKGSRAHALAGTTFLVSMLTMAGIGAIISPMLPRAQWTNTTAAFFTLYIVGSAWLTVRRRPGHVGRFERIAVVVPLAIAGTALALLVWPAGGASRSSFSAVYVFGVLSALAAACDLRMLRAGGIAGPGRTARHLWRMCVALLIASGSFFLGQPDHVPQVLKDTGLNVAPVVGALAVLAFWMVRLRRRSPRQAIAA